MGSRLSDAGARRFAEIAQRHIDEDYVPGLVVLVAAGDDVYAEAFGRLAIDGPKMERDSLFRISSVTKPITAAAVLALVTEGLLALDHPVDDFLPELANRKVLRAVDGPIDDTDPALRAVTTRDLLTFTFGFGFVLEMFLSKEPWPILEATTALKLSTLGPPHPQEPPDPETWIAGFGSLPLLAQPGERWFYNTGAQVLGVLAARVGGAAFPDVLRSRVLEPLGMADTTFWTDDYDRFATAYLPTPEGLVVFDLPKGEWGSPPAFPDGAAGLISTADDLFAFARMLLRGGAPVMSRELAREMTTDQLSPEQKAFGGLLPNFFDARSWAFGQSVLADGSYGWDGGLGTTWLVDPNRELVTIVLTQRMFESPETPSIHQEIQEAARAAVEVD
ncbi:MAG: serine hydrolase domain-containing protein [Acidimicrobiales bacterium]